MLAMAEAQASLCGATIVLLCYIIIIIFFYCNLPFLIYQPLVTTCSNLASPLLLQLSRNRIKEVRKRPQDQPLYCAMLHKHIFLLQ